MQHDGKYPDYRFTRNDADVIAQSFTNLSFEEEQ
jgi:hypothetical protein